MKLIIDLLVACAAAFGASCSRPVLAQWFHGDWYPLVLRVIGVLLLYTAFEKVHHDVEMEEGIMRRFAAFFLSAGAIGAGAAASRTVVREN